MDLILDFFVDALRLVLECFAQFRLILHFLLKLLDHLQKIIDLTLQGTGELERAGGVNIRVQLPNEQQQVLIRR